MAFDIHSVDTSIDTSIDWDDDSLMGMIGGNYFDNCCSSSSERPTHQSSLYSRDDCIKYRGYICNC